MNQAGHRPPHVTVGRSRDVGKGVRTSSVSGYRSSIEAVEAVEVVGAVEAAEAVK